jgi:endonuclease YncB( thermonuclease family)
MKRIRGVFDVLASLALLAGLIVAALMVRNYLDPPERLNASSGDVRVIDGDSLQIGGRIVRLQGIDAPEYRQSCRDDAGAGWPCGREARAALERLAQTSGLTCESHEQDRYRRAVAQCRNATGVDLAEALLEDGWAIILPRYALVGYQRAEDNAREARRGIWRGEFETPSDWRAAHGAVRDSE